MLRVSSKVTETEIDLQMINGEQTTEDIAVPLANELRIFAESLVSGDDAQLADARQALLNAGGPGVLVDAAGVAGNFQRMVRIADATGIPIDVNEERLKIIEELELTRFGSSANSAGVL
jgi:hypothetical protein